MDASQLVAALSAKKQNITTAESCTGGLVAAAITNVSGSSAIFRQGVITYANDAKTELLGVPPALLKAHGAVSEPVARAMAEGARDKAQADLAIAITGIAGPTGGTPEKPVGLVYIGVAARTGTRVEKHVFSGDRQAIRQQAVCASLDLALASLA